MEIAILGLQGAVSEHISSTRRAMEKIALKGEVSWAKNRAEIEHADGVILPGGESTTISRLIEKNGLHDVLQNKPIFGTCAGMILLAKQGDGQVAQTGQTLLGRMDIQVNRNAFGRQRESFQKDIEFDFEGAKFANKSAAFPGVFIRAPKIVEMGGKAHALATLDDGSVVAVRQGALLGTSFHPELTDDDRIHRLFLDLVEEAARAKRS